MEIIGHGFLARSLEPLAPAHPDVVALAAGVSATSGATEADYQREAALVYDTARRCRREGRLLVFFSTASAGMYGPDVDPALEDGPVYPATAYGRHKLALEAAVQLSGARHLILRMTNVIGPEQSPHQLLAALAAQLRTGLVRVHRGATRDLIGVADAVVVIGELLERRVSGHVVNVGSGVATPITAILAELEACLGLSAERVVVDAPTGSRISIDKLRALAPSADRLDFGPDYYRGVIRRYAAQAVPA
jgi:nucleoside-diphosphate-sugar epimerase